MDSLLEKRRQYEAEQVLAAQHIHLDLVAKVADRAPHYLAAVLESLGVGVLLIEGDSRKIVLANQHLAELVNLSIDEILTCTRKSFVRHVANLSTDPAGVFALLSRIPKRGPYAAQCRFNIDNLDSLGHVNRRVIQWEARPVQLPVGTGQLCIYRDVSKEVEATEALQKLADTDVLTGLPNRRRALEMLEVERRRADRLGAPLCVMLLDVDHFKKVNDMFGHQAGDKVLRSVARCLAKSARKGDLAARWGGEEFLLILPDCPPAGAREVSERIRRVVGQSRHGVDQCIAVSSGVSAYRAREPLDSLLQRADELLYRAKAKGRDRVELDDTIEHRQA